jgi:ADP-ribose pyrophosphatase YjhB (NUDIX family)
MIELGQVKQHLWSRLFRATGNHQFSAPVVFAQGAGSVAYYAHPALQELVAAHLHYMKPHDVVAGWSIYCVISASMWDTDCANVEVKWAPYLEYGDAGVIARASAGNVILSRTTRGMVAVDPREKRIAIVAPDYPGAFLESYKVIRQLLTNLAVDGGAISLHASAICCNGDAVAFIGGKGAGKSTALLHSLASHIPGLSYLANDRILLERRGDDITALCWPTVAGFGGAALAKMSGMADWLTPSFHIRGGGIAYLLLDLPLIETIGTRDNPLSKPSKVRLTPRELETLFGVPCVAQARLTTVVNISLDLSLARSELTEVGSEEDRRKVLAAHFEHVFSNHPDWLGLSKAGLEDRLTTNLSSWGSSDFGKLRVLTLAAGQDIHDIAKGICASFRNPSFSVAPLPRWHFGVYGLVIDKGRVLAVRKTRGPYTGLLDLPGGSPNAGEPLDDALRREMAEETGGEITITGPWSTFDIQVDRDSSNKCIQFRHGGRWRYVHLRGIKYDLDAFEDVAGLEWVILHNWQERNDLSAPLRSVLGALPQYCAESGLSYEA